MAISGTIKNWKGVKMPVKIVQVETLLHKEAFNYYYSLGKDRNLSQTAQKFGVRKASVGTWSKSFNWQERVQLKDLELAKKLEAKSDNTIISTKANYRKIVALSLAVYLKNLKAGNVSINAVKEAIDLMKIDLELLGETPQEEIKIIIEDAAYPSKPAEPETENADNNS